MTLRSPTSVSSIDEPVNSQLLPGSPVRKTLPKALPAPTSTESLPTQILTAATDCFYLLFRLTLRLSNIVGAEEIQGRSSGVAVIRPVNLLQTSTSIQRKNKP